METSKLLTLFFIGAIFAILSILLIENPIYIAIIFSVIAAIGLCVFVIVLGRRLK